MNEPDFKKSKLIPAIAQDFASNDVLMLAYMNKKAWQETLRTGAATYWSRSQKKLWKKGEKSGNIQKVQEIFLDCDNDCVLLKVEQTGGACHKGYKACFFRQYKNGKLKVRAKKIFNPKKIYKI